MKGFWQSFSGWLSGLEAFPSTIQSVRANRAFLARAVEYLAAEEGIGQFLDIGTGLPSANNTHEVAQAVPYSLPELSGLPVGL